MTGLIGVVFISVCVIALILEDKKSSKEFYCKRINELEDKKVSLEDRVKHLQKKLELKSVNPKDLDSIRIIHQSDIDKAKSIVSKKDGEFGRQITFEDFIVDSIERTGSIKTKEIFKGLVKIFELAGRDISQTDLIYKKYFIDLPF